MALKQQTFILDMAAATDAGPNNLFNALMAFNQMRLQGYVTTSELRQLMYSVPGVVGSEFKSRSFNDLCANISEESEKINAAAIFDYFYEKTRRRVSILYNYQQIVQAFRDTALSAKAGMKMFKKEDS